MQKEWLTVKETAAALAVSERHVRNMASSGKLKAKKEKNGWLIHSSFAEEKEGTSDSKGNDEESGYKDMVELLREQIREKDKQIEKLQEQLSDTSERQETIIMQLSRQLENSQRMIEASKTSWIRRLFRKSSQV